MLKLVRLISIMGPGQKSTRNRPPESLILFREEDPQEVKIVLNLYNNIIRRGQAEFLGYAEVIILLLI